MSHLFEDFLQTHDIISQQSCSSTPQQNEVAERKNRHLLDVVRTLLLESSTPSRFLCEALSTAVHLINRLPSPTLHHNSPFTKLFGRPPSYSNLRTFGCVCYVHLPAHECTKLTTQSIQCAFLGYSIHQKAPVLNTSSLAPVPSKPLLVYQRRSSATSHQPPAPPKPLPAPSPTAAPVPATPPPPLRQSTRVRRPPDRFGSSPLSSFTATLSSISLPSSYTQAMKHECWRKAVETELLALEENQTWDVVPCPSSVKPIGSKFVFSVKLRFDGSIDRYKAQLVALGNKQEYGLDYDETFAPVTKMTIIRTILALAASQSWPLHQMDVKNAFLHGDLKEEVYLQLPSGMPTSSPNDVCKLKRSLYGLKQAPRVWFEKVSMTPLFFYNEHLWGIVVLLVYVDDIIITDSDLDAISAVQTLLHSTFHMKDLGQLTYFLGPSSTSWSLLASAQVQSRSGSVSRPYQHYFS
ncbi:unnamed protein product [Prunus armeniaca]